MGIRSRLAGFAAQFPEITTTRTSGFSLTTALLFSVPVATAAAGLANLRSGRAATRTDPGASSLPPRLNQLVRNVHENTETDITPIFNPFSR